MKILKKLSLIILLIFLTSFFYFFEINNHGIDETDNNSCLNVFSIEPNIINLRTRSNEYLIIGHAYGNHAGSNKGLSHKVLDYFESLDEKTNLVLTGDFVRSGSKADLLLVQNQVNKYFNQGLFAVGNHEIIQGSINNYYEVFKDDLFLIKESKIDLIVANFSTPNWLPKKLDQDKINFFINNSNNEVVVLFSHQIFWENMTEQKPRKNGPDLLENELNQNMLDWLNFEGKKLIIISGDYGLNSDEIFCEVDVNKNVLFVASGIYENDNDKMIRLNSFDSGFYLEEVRLP